MFCIGHYGRLCRQIQHADYIQYLVWLHVFGGLECHSKHRCVLYTFSILGGFFTGGYWSVITAVVGQVVGKSCDLKPVLFVFDFDLIDGLLQDLTGLTLQCQFSGW